jgi:hypothetical protein
MQCAIIKKIAGPGVISSYGEQLFYASNNKKLKLRNPLAKFRYSSGCLTRQNYTKDATSVYLFILNLMRF